MSNPTLKTTSLKTTLCFIGSDRTKLLAEANDEVLEVLEEHKSESKAKKFHTPDMNDDYFSITISKEMLPLIKFGTPQRCLLKVCDYQFVDEKSGEQRSGAYVKCVGVLPK